MDPLIILSLLFIFLLISNIPIGFIFVIVGICGLLLEGFTEVVAIRQMYHGIDSFTLMAIPFFIFAGKIMSAGKITDQLVQISDSLVGWMRGSLGMINIMVSILFAGISGAAVSDVSALGTMLIPAMQKKGYSAEYSCAITAASSLIGPMIPPSIPMIVYAATTGKSVGALFAGGVIPGLVLGFTQMIINYVIVVKRGYEPRLVILENNLKMQKKNSIHRILLCFLDYIKNIYKSLKTGIFALIMFLIMFGGILSGIFTPTEASGISAAYAIIITLYILKTMNLKDIWNVLIECVSMTGVIMLIMGGGRIISHFLAITGVPKMISEYILGITNNGSVFLLISAGLLIFVGTFMDLIPSIVILAPILAPLAIKYGINPYHFGIIFVFCMNMGLITPPVGGILFVVTSIGKIRFEKLIIELLPFYISFTITILIIIFYEPATIYLPRILGLM